ncbi:MAG: 30S ribosomal protein S6 [Chloroflexota bacterium]
MRQYELALIIHPDLEEAAFKEMLDKVQEWIKSAGGKVLKVDLWGKKKLAYEIRKQTEGQYVFLATEMPPVFCSELEHNLGLQESVMRYMIIADDGEQEPEKEDE